MLTAVLGALNIITLWPFFPLLFLQDLNSIFFLTPTQLGNHHSPLPAYLDVEAWHEYSLQPQGCEGLGWLAPVVPPKLTPPISHDVSHTRRGPRRDDRWEKEEDGLDTTLPWLTVPTHLKPMLSPHLRRTLPALRTTCPRERRTQTATIPVHTTRTNTTGVELALRALAPSTLHISRRNRVHIPPEVLFCHITRVMREVGGPGAVFLPMTEAKGGMGQWDDGGLLNFHFPQ
ncbi:hypothetical protein B0H19DRAFT_1084923 [Mycena capillaripes]|nr:hypothetical protein B0H19DRAFT_1084923 [Mycena capillaripes]